MADAEQKVVDLEMLRDMYERQRQDASQILNMTAALVQLTKEVGELKKEVTRLEKVNLEISRKNSAQKESVPE